MGNFIAVVLVLIFLIYVIVSILVNIGNKVEEESEKLGLGFINFIGRKRKNYKPKIQDELLPNADPLSDSESQLDTLSNYLDTLSSYNAKQQDVQPIKTYQYGSISDTIFSEVEQRENQNIYLPEVAELLSNIPEAPLYKRLFVILDSEEPDYPGVQPKKPKPISKPYATPYRRLEFTDPVFEPPYWSNALSIFNGCVDRVYQSEKSKVDAAKKKKAQLLERQASYNEKIEELTSKAKVAYEKASEDQEKSFAYKMSKFISDKESYIKAFNADKTKIQELYNETTELGKKGLLARIKFALKTTTLPSFVSREHQTTFDEESGVLIHEHRFPDISAIGWMKSVELKTGLTSKPANKTEAKEAAKKLYPSLCLRLATEISSLDEENIIEAITINGWADYIEQATGQQKRAYCASMFATVDQINSLNLSALEPVVAFNALKGIAAQSLELTPIAPIVRLDTNDSRFIDPKEVLSKMSSSDNLATMDWADFEHLCRQLFEKAFAESGAEVKVTQASRDHGVDAIIFDPDPLRGGKIVIQAKRYSNTVDVSAVRDLYGSVMNEGANKGILVTTSRYGPDAYSFAKDKPITLLNGNELLGLLEKHGYKFRIDLAEAKALL